MLVACVTLASRAADAQQDTAATQHRFTVVAGLAHQARRDDIASPLAFAGRGADIGLRYQRARNRLTFGASLDTRWAALAPRRRPPGVPPEEVFGEAALQLSSMRRLGARFTGRHQFDLGVDATAQVAGVQHRYGNPGRSTRGFGFALFALAARAEWTRRVGHGVTTARVSVPLVALMQRPYADVRLLEAGLDAQLVSLSRLRQAGGELSYAHDVGSRLALVGQYRLDILHLDDLQPLRAGAQAIRLGLIWRSSRGVPE